MGIWNRGRRNRGRLRQSVGIETRNGTFTRLIPKGETLPVSLTETFTTADPDQESIKISPFQGEHPQVAFNEPLGLFEVTQIPPAAPGEPLIKVTFHVDENGAFSMTARDARADQDLPVLRR